MDSRDLQERIEELEDIEELDEDEQTELNGLNKLKDECEGYGWDDGIHFIKEYEFEDYARELAEDSYISEDNNPLLNYIDWERWARDVQMDYSEVEFEGTTYYYREA